MAQLAERDREAFVQTRMVQWAIWGGVGLNVLLLGLAGWVVREDVQVRRQAAAALGAANRELESRVQARTAELSQANAQLKAENLEQRWGAQALEHQLRYNELIVNSISDLVLVLTKVKTISRVNPAVTHVSGWEAAELVSHPLAKFVTLTEPPAEYPAVVGDPLGQALKEGRDLRDAAAAIVDRTGAQVPMRLTLFPLRDRDKTVGGVAILRVDRAAGGATGAGGRNLS
jgi:PAS domain S-box-containing protein